MIVYAVDCTVQSWGIRVSELLDFAAVKVRQLDPKLDIIIIIIIVIMIIIIIITIIMITINNNNIIRRLSTSLGSWGHSATWPSTRPMSYAMPLTTARCLSFFLESKVALGLSP